MKTGLVLEGGGMRGVYTIGVLDCLMDLHFAPDYLIGVSAGACNGVSFISGQRGRNLRIDQDYLADERYVSWKNYLKTGSIFGMDFIFREIPNRLNSFDRAAFLASPIAFYAVATDIMTGKPVYFGKEDLDEENTMLRASSSIPGFAQIVEFAGGSYLDGGVSDPIPARKALEDGCDKLVIVLTRDRSYQKHPSMLKPVYQRLYQDYPKLIEAIERRYEVYNQTLLFVRQLEREGRAKVIAPPAPVEISRFENKMKNLLPLYQRGMLDAQKAFGGGR